jgi:hypothetical protein
MPSCQLRSMADITRLKRQTGYFHRPSSYRVEILFANSLTAARKAILERRLAFALSDCGCALSSAGLAIMPFALFLIQYSAPRSRTSLAAYLVCGAIGAALGKLFGLLLSYRVAHRTLDELLVSALRPMSASAQALGGKQRFDSRYLDQGDQ